MARPIATEDEVAAVADQLAAAGEKPSIIRVQAMIGRGSFSTIRKHLDTWQARQTHAPAIELPTAIADQASIFAQAVWQAAVNLAKRDVAQVREEAQRQVEAARGAATEAEQAIARLEAMTEEQTSQLHDARAERDAARVALDAAVVGAQVAAARQEEQAQRIGDLQRQLAGHASELAQARADLLAQARLAGEVDALRRQLATLEQPRGQRRGPQSGS